MYSQRFFGGGEVNLVGLGASHIVCHLRVKVLSFVRGI